MNSLPKREEIDKKYKWNLENIYQNVDVWEEDFKKISKNIEGIIEYKGTLNESADNLLECLKLRDKLMSSCEKLFVYARMKKDENNAVSLYQGLTDRAFNLYTQCYAATSFIVPEIITIKQDTLKKYIESSGELKLYQHYFNEILRQKEHVLSEREEELLALSSEFSGSAREIFTMFNNADIKFPFIKDEEGKEVELTKGRYIKFLESEDRRVRKDAFTALYDTYQKYNNSFAAMLSGSIKSDKFYATASKYNSSLEASLDDDNINTKVYDNLIETVDKNLHHLHRYLNLRKKVLKLDELNMYDLYVPIVEKPKKDIPYEDALKQVENGLKPLGEEYLKYLNEGFTNGWIDVYENEGKTSGAYSWGAYKTHPYVLLNYQGTVNDVFTLAHEMGHALHTFYTNKTQHYIYSEYKIFVAEVASTVNESLLIKYMLNNTKDRMEKAYLLNHYLEQFRATVFRQTMFAEFEKIIHMKYKNGEALTSETLSQVYFDLNKKYFEPEVTVNKDISIEWARIPHFYSSFYVYKYATGFSSATAISNMILNEGNSAVKRYIEFLKGGCSDYPLELLKKAGVDLSTPKPIQDTLDAFGRTVDELENILV
ncbi:oligoendopeptidase F [Herbivorax sp. ANBcel31]|uniref:oligoendopeptidase F n=1 Tax=Herbivorax sp. ANBcel31 TaxID=3069754 RepID=UPI0027B6986A|nr:oligoendopeptidase F [Herbivorax sp. ANBcel31]MDQ2086568.1 oligoendopeptidase F [Herbivorax sp. ANBcel31]